MKILYLLIIILGLSTQNATRKQFTLKTHDKGVFLFTALSSLAAMLFFIFTSDSLVWNMKILPYSIGFAVSFAAALLFSVLAISCGSLSLSALLSSYSSLLPTFYGLIFLNDDISFGLPIGLTLLSVSLFLINKKEKNAKVNAKWIIFILLSFFGNGTCSIVQKMQQVEFQGEYKNEFMIIALLIVALVMAVASVVKERVGFWGYVHHGWYLSIICGIMLGAVNLCVMLLSELLAASVMFPLISAGGIVLTFLISTFLYKEKLTKTQLIGSLLGVASIIFLSI